MTTTRRFLTRACLQASLAAISTGLAAVTAFWPDWIEATVGVDLDGHDGTAEWLLVAALTTLGLALGLRARVNVGRARVAPVTGA